LDTKRRVGKKRILVVEDQEDNRKILRDLLRSEGYAVAEANNGLSALYAAKSKRPDLVLLDLDLPVIDGYETARRFKADPELNPIPIMAVTAYAMVGDEIIAGAAGCDEYLAKPFGLRELMARIGKFLP
jgi:two-component system, cell cycle response regulator DivK